MHFRRGKSRDLIIERFSFKIPEENKENKLKKPGWKRDTAQEVSNLHPTVLYYLLSGRCGD